MKHLPKIEAKVIPHRKQRYDTAGDWFTRWNTRLLRISRQKGKNAPDYEFLLLMHELLEQHLCEKHGISDKDVDRWDAECKDDDPGDNRRCPYKKEHRASIRLEKLIAKELEINWKEFDRRIEK